MATVEPEPLETRAHIDHDPEGKFVVDIAVGEDSDMLIITGPTKKHLADGIAVVERACREARKQIDGVQVA